MNRAQQVAEPLTPRPPDIALENEILRNAIEDEITIWRDRLKHFPSRKAKAAEDREHRSAITRTIERLQDVLNNARP